MLRICESNEPSFRWVLQESRLAVQVSSRMQNEGYPFVVVGRQTFDEEEWKGNVSVMAKSLGDGEKKRVDTIVVRKRIHDDRGLMSRALGTAGWNNPGDRDAEKRGRFPTEWRGKFQKRAIPSLM